MKTRNNLTSIDSIVDSKNSNLFLFLCTLLCTIIGKQINAIIKSKIKDICITF